MYNVDIHTLIKLLLPISLRKPHVIGLLRALMMPVQVLHNALISFRSRKRYEMAITPQVIYLEKVLNDKFNQLGAYPDIYISDNSDLDDIVYMGNKGEDDAAVYLGNQYDDFQEYNVGDEIIFDNITYRCTSGGIDHTPPDLFPQYWELPEGVEEPVVYVGNHDDYNLGNQFTVHVSQAHWDDYVLAKIAEVSATLNKYKTYGLTYKYLIV
jgi:hypothetical protein